ncbi:hypothetical protein KQ945_10415 [Bacillus subtilis subsp. subtilis]|nr:hypothetical protein [Bacillus subtilis subsp. subtilis]
MGKGGIVWAASLAVLILASLWFFRGPSSLANPFGAGGASHDAPAAAPSRTAPSMPAHRTHEDRISATQSSAPSPRHAPGTAAYLDFESAMVQGSALSFDQAMLALKGDAFDHYMTLVAGQSLRVPEAAELTEVYSQTLEGALKENPALSLRRFSCGLSLCAGSISTRGSADEAQFEQWRRSLALTGTTPAYSMIDVTVDGKDGRIEHRFIFSSDAGINGIHSPSLQ